jgi:hypothetical protein
MTTEVQSTQAKRATSAKDMASRHYNQWTDIWQDIYDLVFPKRRPFWDISEGDEHSEQIFDETAVVETPRFASRLVNGTFPFGARAFHLEPGPEFPKAIADQLGFRAIDEGLNLITETVHDALRASNFHDQLHEGYNDLAIGTFNQEVEVGNFPGELVFTTTPPTQVMLVPGAFGYPDGWVRTREVAADKLTSVYPGARLPMELEREATSTDREKQLHKVCEVVVERGDRGTLGFRHHYERTVLLERGGAAILEEQFEGIGSNPWITTRWTADAGETYGRGPLVQALPAIRTLNLTMQLVLQNAQMAIGGVYTFDDDGVLNFENVTIEPGTFIPRSPGSTIDPLQSHSRFDVSSLVLQEMRQNVRAALFNPQPDRPQGRTPPTATEVADDRAEIAVNMGSAVMRIWSEYVQRLVQRVIFLWKKQGIIGNLPRVDGRVIRLVPESPLLRFQRDQDIADYLRYVQALAVTLGPETAILAQKAGATKDYLARLHGIPAHVQHSGEEMEQKAIQATQAAMQASGLSQAQPQLPAPAGIR